ncbi:hypothetical protein SCLCIDRAFT_1215746 [Scleroderma citrinum Foug A]|uniref:Uncharacterized protein n=1 Tax=Scleroderma citrinum Foug A TaxID=1036808 RepID=A0A0C3E0P2_9AGAM|nr:hypothetical protein SCLCIDRAFT_1215746 [Scleroderma citrinum Foug A]
MTWKPVVGGLQDSNVGNVHSPRQILQLLHWLLRLPNPRYRNNKYKGVLSGLTVTSLGWLIFS